MGGPLLLLLAPSRFLGLETAFARTPTSLILLTVPGDITGSETFHFGPKEGPPLHLQLGLDVRPYLLSNDPRGRPTKIEPDKALTQRANLTLVFADDPDAPAFDSTKFSIASGSTFWRRLVLTQPDLVGATLEVRRGFVAAGLPAGDFQTIFKGRVEDYGFDNQANFKIKAKDRLALIDIRQPRQISDTNLVNDAGGLTASSATITVDKATEFTDPADLSSKDLFATIIRLEPDSIPIKLSSASWTAASRQISEAGAFANYTFVEKDRIFLSHASITDGLFSIRRKVSDSNIELNDSIFGSDLTGVVSRPQEDIIIGGVSGSDLVVQGNFLDKSEEFDDSAWVKTGGTTVGVDESIGPFGGDARADTVAFAAVADRIEQDSSEAASGVELTFSVWLRSAPNPSQVSPFNITIDLILSDSTELASTIALVTKDWQRFEVATTFTGGAGQTAVARIRRDTADGAEVVAFGAQLEKSSTRGFYASTDDPATPPGAAAGRGQYGTTAGAHADDTPIDEVLHYRLHRDPESGIHPIFAIRDLINRGGIDKADVNQATFDREFAFEEGVQVKRTGRNSIAKPRKLSRHIKEIREQTLIDLWVSETGFVNVRLSFRQNLPGVSVKTITDAENIIFRSASYDGNKESRMTEVYVDFNPFLDETDPKEPEDFQNHQVVADLAVSGISGIKARYIPGKWLFRTAEALATAGRLVSRFKRGARLATWRLDIKDTGDFVLGDIIVLDSEDVPLPSDQGQAIRGKTNWQVIQKTHRRFEGYVEVQALEFSGLRYKIIAPDEDLETAPDAFPDYPAASGAERQFGFIGDNQNKVAGALTTAPFTLVSASYTAATKRIVETGKFATYTFRQGDAFFPVHASAHPAFYLIASKVDNDTIELEVAIKNVTNGVDDSGDLTGLTNDVAKWRDQLEQGYFFL